MGGLANRETEHFSFNTLSLNFKPSTSSHDQRRKKLPKGGERTHHVGVSGKLPFGFILIFQGSLYLILNSFTDLKT